MKNSLILVGFLCILVSAYSNASNKNAENAYNKMCAFADDAKDPQVKKYYKKIADTIVLDGNLNPKKGKYAKFFGVTESEFGKDAIKGGGEKRSEILEQTLKELETVTSAYDKLAVIMKKDNAGGKALDEVQKNPGKSTLEDASQTLQKAAKIMTNAQPQN